MTKPAPDTDSGLVQATKALGAAMAKYRQAAEVAGVATAALDAALAELNSCQIAVDVAIDEMKKGAPSSSRWQQHHLPQMERP